MNIARVLPFLTAAAALLAATASYAGTGVDCNVSITTSGGTFYLPGVYETNGTSSAPDIYKNGTYIGNASGYGSSSEIILDNNTTAIMFYLPPSSEYGTPVSGEAVYVIQNGDYYTITSSVETCNSYSY
jgi:hypothetical protein